MFALLAVLSSLFINAAFGLDRYVWSNPGESLLSLSLRTGANQFDLQRANPSLMLPNNNKFGQMIRVPGSRFDVDDLDDRKINWGEITKIAGQVNQIGKVLGFDAEDAEDKIHFGKIIKRALPLVLADDVENKKINWGEITKIAGQVNQIGQILGFDVEDLDDKKIKFNPRRITEYAGKIHQIGQVLGYDAEDAEDKVHWSVTVGNEDELENKKINLDEIEKIARQTEQIIQVLKSDDEDFENGFGKKLRKLGRRISRNIRREIPKVTEIAGKVAQVGEALGYDAEDAEDKVHWSVTVGNEDDVENKKINWGEITKIAGQVNQIGKVLGFDAEDLDDVAVTTVCAIIGAACALTNTGLSIYDHVKGDDEAEALEFDAEDAEDKVHWSVTVGNEDEVEDKKINWGEITKIAGQVNQIGKVLGFDAEDAEDKIHLGKIIKRALPLVLAEDEALENRLHPTSVTRGGRGLHWAAEDAENILPGGCTAPFRKFRLPRKF